MHAEAAIRSTEPAAYWGSSERKSDTVRVSGAVSEELDRQLRKPGGPATRRTDELFDTVITWRGVRLDLGHLVSTDSVLGWGDPGLPIRWIGNGYR